MDAPSYPLCVGDVATFSEFPPRQAPDGWPSGWSAAAGEEEVTMDAGPDARGNPVADTTAAAGRPARAGHGLDPRRDLPHGL